MPATFGAVIAVIFLSAISLLAPLRLSWRPAAGKTAQRAAHLPAVLQLPAPPLLAQRVDHPLGHSVRQVGAGLG
jgi:hypothetical protein